MLKPGRVGDKANALLIKAIPNVFVAASPTTLKTLHEMPSTSSDWTALQPHVGGT